MTEIQSAAEELLATLTHGRARIVALAYQALPFGTATRLDMGMALGALERAQLRSAPLAPPLAVPPVHEDGVEEPTLSDAPSLGDPAPRQDDVPIDAEPPEELPTASHEAVEDVDIFGDLTDMDIAPLLPDPDAPPPEEEEDLAEEPSLFDLPLSLDPPQSQGDDEDTVVSRALSALPPDEPGSPDEAGSPDEPEPSTQGASSIEDEATLSDGNSPVDDAGRHPPGDDPGDAALGDAALGDAALGDAALGDAALGDAALGDAALGDDALGDDADQHPVGDDLIHHTELPPEDDRPDPYDDDEYSMGAPRVVQPRLGQNDEHSTVAAVQLLGDGKARPITPTIALDSASEDDELAAFDGDGDDSGHLTLHFEDPVDDDEDEDDEPHIPQLTDIPATPTQPQPAPKPTSPESGDMSRVHDLLSEATDAESHGDLSQAIVIYGDLLGMMPHQLDAYLGRGRCLMELGDYSAAMSDFQRAEDLSPGSAQPVVEMGNLYFARKEYRRAIEFYNHAVDLDEDHAMAWCRRGICHYYRKEHQEAVEDLQQAFKLDPEIPNIRTYVQMALKAMGER